MCVHVLGGGGGLKLREGLIKRSRGIEYELKETTSLVKCEVEVYNYVCMCVCVCVGGGGGGG